MMIENMKEIGFFQILIIQIKQKNISYGNKI